jgi:hypothetical protein
MDDILFLPAVKRPLRLTVVSSCVPAHKQMVEDSRPGQIVNPIPASMLYKPAHGGYPDPKKDQA